MQTFGQRHIETEDHQSVNQQNQKRGKDKKEVNPVYIKLRQREGEAINEDETHSRATYIYQSLRHQNRPP